MRDQEGVIVLMRTVDAIRAEHPDKWIVLVRSSTNSDRARFVAEGNSIDAPAIQAAVARERRAGNIPTIIYCGSPVPAGAVAVL